MLSFLQNLFGGGTQQTQSTSTPVDLNPFTALRGPLTDALQGQLASGGPQYTGPTAAPITANETTQLGNLMGNNGPGTARAGLIDSTLNGNFLPGQPGANPFLDAAIKAAQRPTLEGLTETLDRDLPGRFTAAGQFTNPQGSSAFDRAAALASRGAANALGDIATNMSSNAYTTERTNQQNAIPLSQQEVQTGISNLQAQALPRMIQELGIERGLTLFQQRTSNLLQLLAMIGGVTAPNIANQQQSTGTSSSTTGIIPGLSTLFKPSGGGSSTPSEGGG